MLAQSAMNAKIDKKLMQARDILTNIDEISPPYRVCDKQEHELRERNIQDANS